MGALAFRMSVAAEVLSSAVESRLLFCFTSEPYPTETSLSPTVKTLFSTVPVEPSPTMPPLIMAVIAPAKYELRTVPPSSLPTRPPTSPDQPLRLRLALDQHIWMVPESETAREPR